MPVVASDLKWFGSANMPDADTGMAGGAIDETVKISFTDISPAGTVEALSSDAGDTTQTLTITYQNEANEITTEAHALVGTTPVSFSATMKSIKKAVLSGSTTGDITIRKSSAGGTLATLEAGILTCRSLFYGMISPASGTEYWYQKVFALNDHSTLSLVQAVVKETADATGNFDFGLEATLDDTNTTTDRRTAPSSITFASTDANVANSQNLTAQSAQGVWVRLALDNTDVADDSTTFTLQLHGGSGE